MELDPNKPRIFGKERFRVDSVRFLEPKDPQNPYWISVDAIDTLNFGERHIITRPVPNDGNCVKKRKHIGTENTHLTELPFIVTEGENFLISFSEVCANCKRLEECTNTYIDNITGELQFRFEHLINFVPEGLGLRKKFNMFLTKLKRL